MAQLSTLFIFAGLIAHLYCRSTLRQDAIRSYWVMTFSIGVLEFTVLASLRHRYTKLDRIWFGVFIVAPPLVIVAYLVTTALSAGFFDVVPPRDFSLYERALTQPRILFDYLQNWFLPKLYTTGVFQDHYIKSTGIFSPPAFSFYRLSCFSSRKCGANYSLPHHLV